MATYSLSGSGTQTLTANVVALHVTISTLPAGAGHGLANPTDYWGIGSVRPGNAAAFWDPFVIIGGPQWLPVPFGTSRLGYALAEGAVVSVVEVFTPAPLVFPLAFLPDVAVLAPTDAQVLTYQASTAKWINAAPTGGGGGGTGASASLLLDYVASTDIANGVAVSANTWTNLGPSHSITVAAGGSGLCQIGVLGGAFLRQSGQASAAARLLIDGSTAVLLSAVGESWLYNTAGGQQWSTNPFIGARNVTRVIASGSHTIQVQVYSRAFSGTLYCRTATVSPTEHLQVQVVQLP